MARWMMGESYFHQENYAAAIEQYEKVDDSLPFARWQSAALLQIGKCQELLSQWPMAVSTYESLLKKFPESDLVAEATRRVAAARERLAARPAPKQAIRD